MTHPSVLESEKLGVPSLSPMTQKCGSRIPSGISWMISGLLGLRNPASDTAFTTIGWGLGFFLQGAIALYFVIKSSKIAGFLFKDENE